MKNKLVLFSSVFLLCLTACGKTNVHHKITDYILEDDYVDDYRILQLTDIHLGDKDNYQEHFDFMDLTIEESKPNLIVITGDLFTFASKTTAKRLINYFNSKNCKWTATFGNHDEQCYFSVDWFTSQLEKAGDKCLFVDYEDDDVQGNANFAINLMKGGNVFEQLIIMDSNRYNFGGKGYFGYDYFKDNQIKWYEDLVDYTKAPNLMFYHIPLPQVRDAWAAAEKDKSLIMNPKDNATQGEDPCNPEWDSGFFDVIEKKGYTQGMYFGHDHLNNYIVKYKTKDEYKGIDVGYGVKATDRIYYGESMLGGRTIVLHNDHTLSYEDHYHKYSEVKK